MQQKRYMRIVHNLKYRDSVENKFSETKIKTIYNLYKEKLNTLTYKQLNNISDYGLTFDETINQLINTRSKSEMKLKPTSCKTSFSQRSIKYNSIKFYNELNQNTKKCVLF